MTVQPGLCLTWSETQIVGFLMHRLIFKLLFTPRETRQTFFNLGILERTLFDFAQIIAILHCRQNRPPISMVDFTKQAKGARLHKADKPDFGESEVWVSITSSTM